MTAQHALLAALAGTATGLVTVLLLATGSDGLLWLAVVVGALVPVRLLRSAWRDLRDWRAARSDPYKRPGGPL